MPLQCHFFTLWKACNIFIFFRIITVALDFPPSPQFYIYLLALQQSMKKSNSLHGWYCQKVTEGSKLFLSTLSVMFEEEQVAVIFTQNHRVLRVGRGPLEISSPTLLLRAGYSCSKVWCLHNQWAYPNLEMHPKLWAQGGVGFKYTQREIKTQRRSNVDNQNDDTHLLSKKRARKKTEK